MVPNVLPSIPLDYTSEAEPGEPADWATRDLRPRRPDLRRVEDTADAQTVLRDRERCISKYINRNYTIRCAG